MGWKCNGISLRRVESLKLGSMKCTLSLLLGFVILCGSALATDVRITDSAGVEVLVKDVSIDYGGLLGSDKDTEGVRVTIGDAMVTAKWTDIQSLTVTGRDATAARMNVEIILKSGKSQPGQLLRKGRMKMMGKADLGEYSIDLEKIKRITVVSIK
jgi:hypothetical protein